MLEKEKFSHFGKKKIFMITILSIVLITITNAQGITNTLGGNTANNKFIIENSDSAPGLVVTGEGNVGIGTMNPINKLSVGVDGIFDIGNGYKATIYGLNKLIIGAGIYGEATGGNSIWGATGVHGEASGENGRGIYGNASGSNGIGVYGNSLNGFSGYFSGKVYMGGNVGIGTSQPQTKLHVNNTIRIGLDHTYSSVYGEISHTGGGNGFRINANANGSWADMYLQTDGTTRLFIESAGYVGIGTTSPTAMLSVNGEANKPGGGSWAVFSDVRSKENVVDYTKGLKELLQLRPVSFTYKEEFGWGNNTYVGLSAQEVEQVIPSMVDKININSIEDFRQVNPNELTFMLINAVKELKAENEALKVLIESL